jgi:hypothetical protein
MGLPLINNKLIMLGEKIKKEVKKVNVVDVLSIQE